MNRLKNLWKRFQNAPTPEIELDYRLVDIDLVSNLFGVDEARKHLLDLQKQENISPQQVLKDAQTVELMLRTYPWRVYEAAVWRVTMNAIMLSLRGDTLERREVNRCKAVGMLQILHLPYELSAEKERIQKMDEMAREAQKAARE